MSNIFSQLVHPELTSFLGGTNAGGHDVGGYDTRGCSRIDVGCGSDAGGNDTDESRTWRFGSILLSRRQLFIMIYA